MACHSANGAPKTPRELLDALSPDADDATLAIDVLQSLQWSWIRSASG